MNKISYIEARKLVTLDMQRKGHLQELCMYTKSSSTSFTDAKDIISAIVMFNEKYIQEFHHWPTEDISQEKSGNQNNLQTDCYRLG